jgi:hypothetical protein
MVRKTSYWPVAISVVSAFAMAAAPAAAQVRSVDPDRAIDGDLSGARAAAPAAAAPAPMAAAPASTPAAQPTTDPYTAPPTGPAPGAPAAPVSAANAGRTQQPTNGTFHKDDLIGAAEGVFGKGSRGLAEMIEDILRKQGEPNGYIVGREGGGALVLGLRYGSGTLYHKIEGQRPVYWTGPSIGFDAGANAASAFVLVYNLHDTEDLYKRFGAGEGQAYFIGGFNVSYLRRGDIVLVPVRMGAGLRLGVNAGYMKFSHKQNWLPF